MWENRGVCAFLLLFSLLGITSAQSSGCGSSPCPQANGLFPVPDDCTAFYNCAFCTAHRQQCGPGTAFDPLLHVCNHIHMVDCSGSESYSRAINERKQSGNSNGGSVQGAPVLNQESVASRSSLEHRYGSVQPSPPSTYESSTVPYPYQDNHRSYGHDSSGTYHSQAPARNIYYSGGRAHHADSETGHYTNQDQQDSGPADNHHGHIHQTSQKQYEPNTNATGTYDSQAPARNIYRSGGRSHHADSGIGHYANRDQKGSGPADNHHAHYHQASQKQYEPNTNSTGTYHSQAPARYIYQSGERSHHTDSGTGHHTNQDQQDSGAADKHHGHHHQASQNQYEPNSNATDRDTVAVSTRSRFNHSHITHHPEAVSYLPTHQVVYDHSHGEHHHGDHAHAEDEPPEFSSNNRGSPQLRKEQTDQPIQASTTVTPTQNRTASDAGSFDLKDRYVANSGFVPSYVQGQMREDAAPKANNYGEREYVRAPNRQTQESGIRNLQGQPISPNRFYTDDVSAPDADSQESPAQLTADDLRHFQQNQAAQGIPYIEASSDTDRQGRNLPVQPGFRRQYQYSTPSPTSSLASAASSLTNSGVAQTEQNPENSGQLFVEHRRRKQSNQDMYSLTADTRGQSENDRSRGAFVASESQEHVVYVSAPVLPTPQPLMAGQAKKEYHHMGYRFDHDPLRENVKTA